MTGENAGLYRPGVIMWLMVFLIAHSTHSAPLHDEDTTQVAEYEGAAPGCYYNFQYYEEGDRIMTNEPCLNCTCHNRMLMCYLRVCPQFTKAIGQNCQVEKRPDQCCPVITCPEVPVHLLTSTTSAPSSSSDSTEVGFHDNYGCSIDNKFYADGAQLPTDPNNPCELCYCIRNRTTCTMQQCTLKIARCSPVFHPGICCPVKYDCDYDEEPTTTPGTTPGLIMTTTMAPGIESPKCTYQGKLFNDGDLLYSTEPCHHCYCFNGDIACAIQECGKPMETHGKNCTAVTPPEGECCPTTYKCDDETGSIEDEEQQQVTHDENEIVATQATLPAEKVNEEEQKHEGIFPGADNTIPEVHQVQEEVTSDTTGVKTTQAAIIESHPSESTTTTETNEVAVKDTTPVQVLDDNDVPQKPVEAVTPADETAQSTEEFRPTESAVSTESVEPEKLTTIVADMEATKSPGEYKPEGEKPMIVTEMQIEPSEKPSTSLPARSEDQVPVEPPTTPPGEISTHLPRSENDSTEAPTVTEPVTSVTNEILEGEIKPVTTIPESNEIPKGSEAPPAGEITAKPEDTMATSGAKEVGEIKPEVAPTEPSVSEMPKISEEPEPVTELPKAELPEGSEEKATVQPDIIPDISNRIPEQESTSVTAEEKKPEEIATITSSSANTSPAYEEPVTETIEPEMNEVPTQGPPGIVVPTRGPVTKAEDNESVPEVQVTEGYGETPGAGEVQSPENLMTDKPEVPAEVSSETAVMGGKNITENSQIPVEEPALSMTEAPTTKPEEQTSSEHNEHISPTQATEVPSVDENQSTVSAQPEGTSMTPSTGITKVDMPTKGIQVSGEQSSEEVTSSEAPTTDEKHPDSSESSSEEEGEEPSSPFTPLEHPSSTESSSKTESEITTEEQVTVPVEEKETIAPTEHEILTEKVPTEASIEVKPTEINPMEESSTETSTELQTTEKKPTDEQPTEGQVTEKPIESKPVEEVPTSGELTEKSPVEQPEEENSLEKSTVQPEQEHSTKVLQTEEKLTERPIVEQPAAEQTTEEATTEVQPTEKSVEQPAERQPSEKPTEMLPVGEHVADEKSTENPINVEPTDAKPMEEHPTKEEPTDVQLTTETPTEKPLAEEKPSERPIEEPSVELKPTGEKPAEVGPNEVELTTATPSEEAPTEGKPSEKPTENPPETEKPTEKPSEAQPEKDKPSETRPVEEKTTETPVEEQSSVTKPTENQTTDEKSTDIPPTEEIATVQPKDQQPAEGKPVEEKPVESQTERGETGNDEEAQTAQAHPAGTEGQTELPQEKLVTVGVEVGTSTSSSTELSPTSLPAETEQTEDTKIAEEITEPSVTSVPQELSTEVIEAGPTSEESGIVSTELPVKMEDVSKENASEQPTVEVKPEVKPAPIEPSEESIIVSEHTESSPAEHPSTEFETSQEGEKQQTEQPTTPEEMKTTEISIAEDKPIEEASAMPTDTPKIEPEQEGQTMNSDGIGLQTTEAVTEPALTEGVSSQQEAEIEGDIPQTPIPSIIPDQASETAVTEAELAEHPGSTDSTAPEEQPNKESVSHPTEMHASNERPTESTMSEITFPESNELPGQTQLGFEPNKQSTEKVAETTSTFNEQEITMKPVVSAEQHPSVPTESSETNITPTETIPEAEEAHTSVHPDQQPNEEPVRTTEISSEIPTTVSSDLPTSHAGDKPVESTEEHTITPIPTQEQTSGMPAESVTVPTKLPESQEVTQEHVTSTLQSESPTTPATANEESPVNNEQPHETSEPSASTEHATASGDTTVNTEQLTEKPEGAQEEKPTEEEFPSAVTSSSTSAIEKETTPFISAETETPIDRERIITDAPVLEASESTTKLPVEGETPEVTSPVFISSTEQRPESPVESSNQTVESTEQSVEEKPSSTEGSAESSPTTSGGFKPSGIPGEGNCLIDGESFTNNSEIPPANPCQISCHCVSSIVQCELVQCPPPPSHLSNCMPIHISSDTCCPMYSCDALPTATLEADNQMAGHPEPEDQNQETEKPTISETPVEESKAPEEPTTQPKEHTISPVSTEESSSVPSAETATTSKPETSVAAEQPSDVTPEITTETNEHPETPAIVTKEITSEIEVSSTLPPLEGVEFTKASEPAEDQTVPSVNNRVGESDGTTSVPEKEIPTEAEPTTVPQIPEDEAEVAPTVTAGQDTIIPEEAQTESGMISTEGIKEPTTSVDVQETMSSATDGTSEAEPSTESSVIPTTAEPKPVESEEATSIAVGSPITEKEPVEKSSEQPHEQTPSLEHSNEMTQTSPIEKLPTEPAVTEQTGAPPSVPEVTKSESAVSPTVTEQTTPPIVPEVETMTSTHEESESEPTEETPAVSDTEIPSVTEEHKQISQESSETPQTEMTPQKTDVTPDNESVTAISEAHPTAGEESTPVTISEGTTQPSLSSEEPGKLTEAPELSEGPTEPAIVVKTSTSVEPTLSTESSSQPSIELSSPPIIPEMSEHPVVTETSGAENTEPAVTESSNIPSQESGIPTSAHGLVTESEIEVTETPTMETSKSEEEHEIATSIPVSAQTEEVSEEPAPTTSSATAATEAESTESQSDKDETEKPLGVTSVTSVETDLPTKLPPTQGYGEGTEGIKSVTKPSDLETPVTEIIATEKASEAPPASGESAESLPPSTEETSSQNVNIPVITDKPEEETISPVDEASSSSASHDSTPTTETPSGEQPLASGAPAEASTEIPHEEESTEFAGDITKTPEIPLMPTEIPVIIPVDEIEPTVVPAKADTEVGTEIKTAETPKPIIEEVTSEHPQEAEPVETSSPPEHTPSTTSPVVPESSTQSEDVSPTTITVTDDKSTGITDEQPIKPEETPVAQSEPSEATTLLTIEGSTPQAPIESSSELTQASTVPVNPEETLVTELKPTEDADQTTPEVHAVEPVDKATSPPPSSEPTEEIQDNQVPESPMTPEQHTDTAAQQTIAPIEPEVVQEHVTESDKNITSPHHTYVPPSSTESPTGGEYPEQSVSGEDNPHFPVHGGTQLTADEDYEEDDQAVYGPGTCRYGGKVYVSAQQIPRDDPCDFCFCFRSDIICLQQSCPPPIPGCHEEPIGGFCCPRYECPVSMATSLNITTTTTTTTTTLPPHFLSHAYKGATRRSGCQIRGQAYKVGEVIQSASGPCLHCTCGGDGNMKCEPRVCSPEPMIRQMIAAATAKRRR